MVTLLHIDSSVLPGAASSSRSVGAAFVKAWEEQHPQGTVIHRDLATDPVPHMTAAAWTAGYTAPSDRTPEQSAAFAARLELIEELEQADAVLIGAPMHNFSIPSTLKAWLDSVLPARPDRRREALRPGRPGRRHRHPRRLVQAGDAS